MTMEKYGTDLSNLPATDDQVREINKMAKTLNVEAVELPKNMEHANQLIAELSQKTLSK